MRLLYLHQYFNTPAMSGGTRSYEMARRLVARGHDVQMITTWRDRTGRRGWFETDEDGIRVHWLPVRYGNEMGYARRIAAFSRYALVAHRKARALGCDVILASSTPLTVAVPAVRAARRLGVPMVFEVRDLWPEVPIAMGALRNPLTIALARRLERFAYRNAAQVVALSPGMAGGVAAAGYPAERIACIPNAADLELFDPGRADGAAFRAAHPQIARRRLVVYCGTFGRVNGVSYLARIAAEAARIDPDTDFLAVGAGAEEGLVRDTATRLGVLGRNFHLLPPVPKSDMPAILAAADLSLSLVIDVRELWANSANKFFDSLASGTPIGVNYGGWQAELIREHGLGPVLPPGAPARAAQQVKDFLDDHEGCKAAAIAARRVAVEKFDRNRLAEQLESVLLRAVHG